MKNIFSASLIKKAFSSFVLRFWRAKLSAGSGNALYGRIVAKYVKIFMIHHDDRNKRMGGKQGERTIWTDTLLRDLKLT